MFFSLPVPYMGALAAQESARRFGDAAAKTAGPVLVIGAAAAAAAAAAAWWTFCAESGVGAEQ